MVRIRQEVVRGSQHTWYEYLLEYWRSRNEYQFPQCRLLDTEPDEEAGARILHKAAVRGLAFEPRDRCPDARSGPLEVHFKAEVRTGAVPHRVYLLPFKVTQPPRASRLLQAPPDLYWVSEGELAVHEHVGMPFVFGCPVASRTLAAVTELGPLGLQFASAHPPLVLYHGTDAAAGLAISRQGFRVSHSTPVGMLGRGVYLAKWDKAETFAQETADRRQRPEPGVVVRTFMFAPAVRKLESTDRCGCGSCAGLAFVDHDGKLRGSAAASFVPDNSLPATRRAEWCVADAGYLLPDCLLQLKSSAVKRGRFPA